MRIKLLESALLEIHDLDNRMKMELLALNTLASPNDEFCEEDCMTFISTDTKTVKYELVDLNDDVADYEASIDKIDKEIQLIDFHQSQSYIPKSHVNVSTLQTFNYRTDHSLRLSSNVHNNASCLPVDIDFSSE
ncbi:hypothetical protein KSF78_0002198 [Schistosoma japonicum]|nr:hypothetical protein KSF78_0002198 [Schistosoma japonicum]